MKKLAVLMVVFLALPGCTMMRKLGGQVCSAQQKIADGAREVGSFFGPIGSAAAGVVNITLSAVCGVVDVGLSAPADLVDDVTGGDDAPAEEVEK